MNGTEMIKPPTDSLYKFMAISGLLLLVFCLIYPEQRRFEVNIEKARIDGELKILISDNEVLKQDLELLMDDLKDHKDRAQKMAENRGTATELTGLQKRQDELERKKLEQFEKERAFKTKLLEIQTKIMLLNTTESFASWLAYLSKVGFVVGACLMISGFLFWYLKVQQPQDRILEAQAKHELEKLSVPLLSAEDQPSMEKEKEISTSQPLPTDPVKVAE
jgi:hypothetical protein